MTYTTYDMLKQIVTLYQKRNLRDAEILCRQILEKEPDNPDANHFLGIIAWEVGELEIAKNLIGKAIELNPDNSSCYLNMGNVYQKEKKYSESLIWYEKALGFGYAEKHKLYNSIGVALTKLGRLDEAIENIKRAVELDSNYVEAYNNLGDAFKQSGQIDRALQYCEKAIDIFPEFVPARWNRSILWFLKGRFSEAWQEYEWRWKRPQTPVRKIDAGERWEGQPFQDKTLFVYEEQGMGDTIQFIRYLPYLKQFGGSIIFEVIPPLVRLVEQFKGYDRLWVGIKNVDTRPVDRFDYHVPLLSLPGLFNTTVETIPAETPYLYADQTLSRIWKDRIGNVPGLKAGIVWSGNPNHDNDNNRSLSLSCFRALGNMSGINLFSLQKDSYEKWTDIDPETVIRTDLGKQISDFADTAAIIENLDLVISVDTAVVHLAGAMGKPVWTLLPFCPDWRWMLDREDTPWYPSMRLFRQPRPGDWDSVISDVKQALEGLAKNNKIVV